MLLKNAWHAGKGANCGEESYHKNPWRFFTNGYFATLRDEHHGVWTVTGNRVNLTWRSADGWAVFNFQDNFSFKCSTSGWDFMKNWAITP